MAEEVPRDSTTEQSLEEEITSETPSDSAEEVEEAERIYDRPAVEEQLQRLEESQVDVNNQMKSLNDHIRRQEDDKRIDTIIEKIIKQEQPSEDDIFFIQSLGPDAQKSFQSRLEEKARGVQAQQQDPLQQEVFANLNQEQQALFHKDIDFQGFARIRDAVLKKGGHQFLHITDTHLQPEETQRRIQRMKIESGFDPNRDVIGHTGDTIEDFFSRSLGLKAFLPKRIIAEGGLEDKIAEEFKQAYGNLLKIAGIDEEALLSGKGLDSQEGQYLVQNFQKYLFGQGEPETLTEEELISFREDLATVHTHLRSAIKYHARKQYEQLRSNLEEEGLTPDNFIIIGGNHDVPEVMTDVLGDYMIEPGTTKEVGPRRFVNFIAGSNGNFLGGADLVEDLYGIVDSERRTSIRRGTHSFQKLLEIAKDHKINIDERGLDRAFDQAKIRESFYGVRAQGGLSDYFKKIESEMDETVKRIGSKVPRIPLQDGDIVLNHGMVTHPNRTGEEEREVHNYLRSQSHVNFVAPHGHEHGNTSHIKDGVLYPNPGEGTNGAYQTMLYDADQKDFVQGLFKGRDSDGLPVFRMYNRNSLEVMKSQDYRE